MGGGDVKWMQRSAWPITLQILSSEHSPTLVNRCIIAEIVVERKQWIPHPRFMVETDQI